MYTGMISTIISTILLSVTVTQEVRLSLHLNLPRMTEKTAHVSQKFVVGEGRKTGERFYAL